MYYELSILIYNIAYRKSSDYDTINMAVANDFGLIANESIIQHLNLERFDINYHFIPSYMLQNLDETQYDCIVSTSYLYQDVSYGIPFVRLDYLLTNINIISFWNTVLSNKRKSSTIMKQLSNIKRRKINATTVTIISLIIEEIEKHGYKINDIFNQLKLLFSHQKSWYSSDELNITILSRTTLEPSVFEFYLQNELEINNENYTFIRIAIINPHKKLISIKQTDSSIVRFNKGIDL